ncbi:MAG: asparagine synthase (glutamine-hydrolyzing) [Limisphaerales bacterium]
MCGIAGYVGGVERGLPEKMNRVQRHRGPDGEGIFADAAAEVALAHTRLAILDLSAAAGQPMRSPDGRYVLIFNGEIYNFRELRANLQQRGHRFVSTGDTEVILHGVMEEGCAFLARLNGMFALAIWDRQNRELFLARDQLGIKPVYYATPKPGTLLFASEIKALCAHPEMRREPDFEVLQQHLAYCHAASDRTALKGVRRLEPGCMLRWRQQTRAYQIEPFAPLPIHQPAERGRDGAAAHLRELISAAVTRQLVSDVPLGVFLSGGLDSSLIAALAARTLGRKVQCYTITYPSADNQLDRADEDIGYARLMARQLGATLQEIELQPKVAELWPKLIWHLDEPIADPAAIACYLVCQLARSAGTKVLLSGQGGDELFCGYPRYWVMCRSRWLRAAPKLVREVIASAAPYLPGAQAGALQGIRLAAPALGERIMVTGLGLIGLLTVQLLRAHGCEVLGVDLDEGRLKLARQFGAATVNPVSQPDVAAAAQAWSSGAGVDAVIVTASAKTDEVMHQAAQSCRKRGRIVLVGVVGLNLWRDDFYKKELTFQVSCSFGPGRYDEKYEQRGQDYPLPYVRWTEQRNFEAVLGAMRSGAIDLKPLITHRFKIGEALRAYEAIQKEPAALGVLLEYPVAAELSSRLRPGPVAGAPVARTGNRPVVGFIGAGNFARAILLPALAKTGARLRCIAARTPVTVAHAARKFHFEEAATDYHFILDNPEISVVFIATGHDTHARLVCEALSAGKHVFVEKPLCLNEADLAEVSAAYQRSTSSQARLLMAGFNRRFSAHTLRVKEVLAGRSEPLCLAMTVNAGAIPADHWVQDMARGGGRIIGEACHFIDLLSWIAGAAVTEVSAIMVGKGPAVRADKMCIQLSFRDGSIGTVNYFANGSKSYPKEILEIFSEGRIARLENFRATRFYGFAGPKKFRTWRQDKGHEQEVAAFIDRADKGGEPLISFAELENVTRASFCAMESALHGGARRLSMS